MENKNNEKEIVRKQKIKNRLFGLLVVLVILLISYLIYELVYIINL